MLLEHEIIQSRGTMPFNAFTFTANDSTRIIPQHWHQSTEIVFCIAGSLNIWIDGYLSTLHKNDVVVINPNVTHYTQSPEPNHVLCLQLPLIYLQQLTENKFANKFLFDFNTVQTKPRNIRKIQDISTKISKAIEANQTDVSISMLIKEQSLVLNIISELVERNIKMVNHQKTAKSDNPLQLMDSITRYISDHYSEQLTLHGVASYFNYSDSYFSRLFKSNFGINFYDFLISVRLNEATHKILTTSNSMTKIAEQCGFETYRNFYNAFIRIYQTSPKSYREHNQDIVQY